MVLEELEFFGELFVFFSEEGFDFGLHFVSKEFFFLFKFLPGEKVFFLVVLGKVLQFLLPDGFEPFGFFEPSLFEGLYFGEVLFLFGLGYFFL